MSVTWPLRCTIEFSADDEFVLNCGRNSPVAQPCTVAAVCTILNSLNYFVLILLICWFNLNLRFRRASDFLYVAPELF